MTAVIGLDVGYGWTKIKGAHVCEKFASITGTADVAQFGIDRPEEKIIDVNGRRFIVGNMAVEQSRFLTRREDRAWIETDEYMALVHNALLYVRSKTPHRLVTGLPIAFFDDRDRLHDLLIGEQIVNNGRQHRFVFDDVRVIPQPFGSLFAHSLHGNGATRDASLLVGKVGVIDVGSKTTNLLTALRGHDVPGQTDSISLGGWNIVRAVRAELQTLCRDADWQDHEIADAVQTGSITYNGETLSLRSTIADIVSPFAEQVKASATQLWNGGATLAAILVTGGGAHLVGEHVKAFYKNHKRVIVMNDPQFANVEGYYRYGMFRERHGK